MVLASEIQDRCLLVSTTVPAALSLANSTDVSKGELRLLAVVSVEWDARAGTEGGSFLKPNGVFHLGVGQGDRGGTVMYSSLSHLYFISTILS